MSIKRTLISMTVTALGHRVKKAANLVGKYKGIQYYTIYEYT